MLLLELLFMYGLAGNYNLKKISKYSLKDRACSLFFRPRTGPKTILQCFALEQRKYKAKHCRNVLGRVLGRKNKIQIRSLISNILTNGQNWKCSQIIPASKYADKKASSYPHDQNVPVYFMPKSRHAFSAYATFIYCSWWKNPLMHWLEREQNKHFVA